jgi:hypothetical protein
MGEAHEGSIEDDFYDRPYAPGLLSPDALWTLDVYRSDPRARIATQHGTPKDAEMRRHQRSGWVVVAAAGEYGTTWRATPEGLEVIRATIAAMDATADEEDDDG